jgi:hypothetical protein
MNNNTRNFFGFLIASVFTASASAALYDRGNGMIYDSTQNITWLQDANYAKTSGYDSDGAMNWSQAKTWSDNLVYGGFSDWRLPSAHVRIGGTDLVTMANNEIIGELGYMFVANNISYYSYSGSFCSSMSQDDCSPYSYSGCSNSFFDCSSLSNSMFWYKEDDISANHPIAQLFGPLAFAVNLSGGIPNPLPVPKGNNQHAWAVRDGDVLSANEVPVPAAAWLMGSGLIGLAGLARRKK